MTEEQKENRNYFALLMIAVLLVVSFILYFGARIDSLTPELTGATFQDLNLSNNDIIDGRKPIIPAPQAMKVGKEKDC